MTDRKPLLITIDGPAGAGKTTVSKKLAKALSYKYIDTGALYRGVALAAKRNGVLPHDDSGLESLCGGLKLRFKRTDDGLRLCLNEEDITDCIRTPELSMLASDVSARPVVRRYLLDVQKEMGREKAVVFEGRDMGTVVFPNADVKFFLDASPQIRATRRYRELAPKTSTTFEKVEIELNKRDKNDAGRAIAPLKPAQDAVIIDSSNLSIPEVVEEMRAHIDKLQNE